MDIMFSYAIMHIKMVDPVGFEPTVNRLWAECFNQLS